MTTDPGSARASRKSRGSPAIIEAGGSGAANPHTAGEMREEDRLVPSDLAAVILRVGEAEWGATDPLTAEQHAANTASSVAITAEAFEQSGPQPMHGLYIEGTETIICHTGTSPNSAAIARALTGAWNRLLVEARLENSTALSSQHNADAGGEAVHSSPATDEQP